MIDENQSVKTGVSDESQPVKSGWTSVQVYTMSVLCLVVGVGLGYLFRGPAASPARSAFAPAVSQPQMGSGNPVAGAQPGGMPEMSTPPGQEQMKAMADKKVAPLLEQLNKNPRDIDVLTKIGRFYFAAQQFDDAAKYFGKAADFKPTAEAITNLANAQAYGGAGDKAIATLNRALEVDPKYANALFNLGVLKWQVKGDLKGAIACWEKLLKTNPNNPHRVEIEKMIARAKEHEKIPAGTKTDKPAM
jgi:cytochrome c-type biogenesis protein CcmH/NrfG